ncbi:hypothetical protein HanRHA438_Chr03g0113641 [Helianthus annuus]|nr:hypothetical protein HanRHA438_Chr03g0113641 [Helianthus annuus]
MNNFNCNYTCIKLAIAISKNQTLTQLTSVHPHQLNHQNLDSTKLELQTQSSHLDPVHINQSSITRTKKNQNEHNAKHEA